MIKMYDIKHNNTRKILALVLAVCLVIALVPMTVSAGTYWAFSKDSLIKALEGSDSSHTITMTANIMDVQETIFIPSGKNVTLDLGGYTISNMGYHNSKVAIDQYMVQLPVIAVEYGATLTIKNFKPSGDVVNSSKSGIAIANQGTLIIEGGTFIAEGKKGVAISNSGNLILTKGTISGQGESSTALLNNGVYTNSGGSIIAKGYNATEVKDNNPSGTVGGMVSGISSKSAVIINGTQVNFDAYTINGNNYFKLRDVAYELRDTGKKFSVEWKPETEAIHLYPNMNYTAVGGEMAAKGTGSVTARLGTHAVYLKDVQKYFQGYNIGGNNYYMLRDIAREVDFAVTWDAAGNRILINTNAPYVPE